MEYGLVGEKLQHSYSAKIHRELGVNYILMQQSNVQLTTLLKQRDFKGLNITIPYKQIVMPLLDYIDGSAERIGAVNTIVNREGKLYGYNTDYNGMRRLIDSCGVSICGQRVVILGSGGTSRTAQCVAQDLSAKDVYVISRGGEINYDNIYDIADINVIINTTPYGMYPELQYETLVDISRMNSLKLVIDCVYNPTETSLVYESRLRKIPAVGGLPMLVSQAVAGAALFGYLPGCSNADRANYDTLRAGNAMNGVEVYAAIDDYERTMSSGIINKILSEQQNIILVGMPSSGKSFLADRIANALGKEVFDSDIEYQKIYQQSPADTISSIGEDAFRLREEIVIKELCSRRGVVIATGGGAILSAKNRYYIKSNAVVVHVSRDLSKLIIGGNRPLSASHDVLAKMFAVRNPIYKAIADYTIDNNRNYGESSVKQFLNWLIQRGWRLGK